tara:strand:+ start:648 stop:959 length:312 start_codon:yes stop_codon:yes gene_type:complete
MTHQNQMSDKQIADYFNAVRISGDTDAIYRQRCMISLIASKLSNLKNALPLTAKSIDRDMRGLHDHAVASNESNIISFLEQNGYSATLAYQFALKATRQDEAA